ncbi:sigma 54-interacting transcriptional regulator, partial [Corynebacterium sp. 35RC1]|nr:sigma 54-interacting transcriptional regulator [Corynebacterium sp. 35RC1]
GETGAGKEYLARALHAASGRSGAFIAINCAAIPEALLESELFGYLPGTWTGANAKGREGLIAAAHEGTLFLDEIGDMPLDLQVKLLQVLQDRVISRLGSTRTVPVDVRVVAATNRDLEAMVRERTFRDDLFYRLNVVPLRVPPLAERKDDIAPMVFQFLREFNQRYGVNRIVSEEAMTLLLAYDWPGNVRELRNAAERLCLGLPVQPLDGGADSAPSLAARVDAFERKLLRDTLDLTQGNVARAAELLRIG